MTPAHLRARLFKNTRPLVRPLEIMDGEGYTKDAGRLWAAYKKGAFPGQRRDMSQEEFASFLAALPEAYAKVWLVDDDHPAYQSGRGPVAIVCAVIDDLLVTLEADVFPWATKRNILRGSVAVLKMLIESEKTGTLMVKVPGRLRGAASHLKKYDLLYYVGRIGEDVFLYAMRGRGSRIKR